MLCLAKTYSYLSIYSHLSILSHLFTLSSFPILHSLPFFHCIPFFHFPFIHLPHLMLFLLYTPSHLSIISNSSISSQLSLSSHLSTFSHFYIFFSLSYFKILLALCKLRINVLFLLLVNYSSKKLIALQRILHYRSRMRYRRTPCMLLSA